MPDTGKGPWTALQVTFDGKTVSCGGANWNANWKVGDEIEIETFTNAKGYLAIATPKMAEKVKGDNEVLALLKEIRDILKVKAI